MPTFRRFNSPASMLHKKRIVADFQLSRPALLKMLTHARHSCEGVVAIEKKDWLKGIRYPDGSVWVFTSDIGTKKPFSSTEVWLRGRVLWKPSNKRPSPCKKVSSQVRAKYSKISNRAKSEPTAWKRREWDKLWGRPHP